MKLFAVLSLFVTIVAMPTLALAADISIVDARRNIPLSDDEPAYKDFYLNAGDGSGLKKNLVVTAVRKLTVRDAAGSQAIGDIEVPVGQLRVIAVFGRVAVAREYKLLSRDENPMLEQAGLMVGDRIDLKGSFVDNKIVPLKKKVSDNETTEDAARATASVTVTPATPATVVETSAAAPAKGEAAPVANKPVEAAPAEASSSPLAGEKTAASEPTVH